MANLVMTVLEAHVPEDRWADLKQGFARIVAQMPKQLVQSFAIQSIAEPTLWRLMGVWQSREAFEEYRASVPTPGGVVVFQDVGVTPSLNLFEVKARM